MTRNNLAEKTRRRRIVEVHTSSQIEPLCDADPVEFVADAEYTERVTQRCLQVMRSSFSETTRQAFWNIVVDDQTTPEVAEGLKITVSSVCSAKVRVLYRPRSELRGLVDDLIEPRSTNSWD